MNISEMRKLDSKALELEVNNLKKELLNMRLNVISGQVKDTSMFRKNRVTIARALTVLNEARRSAEQSNN